MAGQIAVSMMCADITNLKPTLDAFQKCKIEYLHIDVMDGVFVPNFQLGTDYVKQMRRSTSIPLDIHLMITNPEDKLDWFDIQEGEYVSIHYESSNHVQRALARIKQKGAKTMLALNPATPLVVLEDCLPDIDAVLLMTVNPGFAGQSLVPQMLGKITRLKKWLQSCGYPHIEIEVDGNVNFENAKKMRDAGADIFVAGSSSVFHKDMTLESAIDKLRDNIKGDFAL